MPDEEYYIVSRTSQQLVADAIREKNGTSALLTYPQEWADTISSWGTNIVSLYNNRVITIQDGVVNTPIIDLTIGIQPVRSGTGQPSFTNIRSFTGWTGASIYVSPTLDNEDGETYTVSWQTQAGTVYSGKLDVTTGILTLDKKLLQYRSDNNTISAIAKGSSNNTYSITVPDCKVLGTAAGWNAPTDEFATSHFPLRAVSTTPGASPTQSEFTVYTSSSSGTLITQFRLSFPTSVVSTGDGCKTWLQGQQNNGHPVQVLYPLKQPLTYQLTAIEIDLLAGTNNIWTNINGENVCLYYTATGQNYKNVIGGSGGGGGGTYQAKTGITPTESSQTITADSGYDALSSVQIDAISSSYVGSGIAQRSSSDLSASGATVTAPAGYYSSAATKSVSSGTAGTPTATKGTVSNHSISITPSVTNTTGYITGSTVNGTAVTVSASELVSGSETKTANGTYDVTNLASLVVNVSGGLSNVVTGTFKGTTTGAAMDVTLGYSGSGYPIAVMIYPDEGPYNGGTGTFYNLVQRYVCVYYAVMKIRTNETPDYSASANKNYATGYLRYKNSTSSATSQTGSSIGTSTQVFQDTNATSGASTLVKIRSKTKMSVFIASSSYGFAANVDYRYWVMYSS